METHQRFIQWSPRQLQRRRNVVVGIVAICICNPPDIQHLLVKVFLRTLVSEEVHQRKLLTDSKLILNCQHFYIYIIH